MATSQKTIFTATIICTRPYDPIHPATIPSTKKTASQ